MSLCFLSTLCFVFSLERVGMLLACRVEENRTKAKEIYTCRAQDAQQQTHVHAACCKSTQVLGGECNRMSV